MEGDEARRAVCGRRRLPEHHGSPHGRSRNSAQARVSTRKCSDDVTTASSSSKQQAANEQRTNEDSRTELTVNLTCALFLPLASHLSIPLALLLSRTLPSSSSSSSCCCDNTMATTGTTNSRIHHFKLVLLGDTAVGKSCLVVRFVRDEFFEFQEPTIGGM
jgi:hypothetical protein